MIHQPQHAPVSASGTLQTRLAALAPATSGRLDGADFLLLGAAVGLVGWTATAVLELLAPDAGVLALAVWLPLVAVMLGAALLHAPDAMRFSAPMLGWGPLNGLAATATLWAVLFGVPDTLGGDPFNTVVLGPDAGAVWSLWTVDLALGYAWTADALRRDGQPSRAAGYSYAAFLGFGLAVYHGAGIDAIRAVRYPALAALHALPLALDARTDLGGVRRTVVLYLVVFALVGVGALL
jgi:hypothetical protein